MRRTMSQKQRIRQRKSYKLFKKFYKETAHCYKSNDDVKTVMLNVCMFLDNNKFFANRTNRDYSLESIELVIKDLELS